MSAAIARRPRPTRPASPTGRCASSSPSPEETDTFADLLESEGIPLIRRHRFVLVGAASEEDARELAERLRAEAPAGAKVEVEPSGEMVYEVMPRNPFAIFGGLGL